MKTKDSNSEIYYPKQKNNKEITTNQEILQWNNPLAKNFAEVTAFGASWQDKSQKALNPYYGMSTGSYYMQTGMPWLAADARKAVLTEWFWQPIRGQPRRVDTNELRKYSNTVWVQSIEQAILNQITYADWVIAPKKKNNMSDDTEKAFVEKTDESESDIELVEEFLDAPNQDAESFPDILRAVLKDVLEIDAGVIVKIFTIDSYDFEHLEPRSGAPLLKPLNCPICNAEGKGNPKKFGEKAFKTLKSIDSMERKLPRIEKGFKEKGITFIRPNYSDVKEKMAEIVQENSDQPKHSEVSCPFCNGTGKGRTLKEIKAYDGSSFLMDVDRTGKVIGYWQYSYSIPAHPMWFNKEEIIYFKMNNRSMSPYGYSAVQSSLDILKSLESSIQHNKTLFIDGAVPDGIVGIEDMSNEELARMKTVWENDIKGQPHKVVFVNKRAQFQTFAFNNRDMQFLEGQKEAWNQVIANFNMSPSDLGITRDVHRSSATAMGELTKKKAIRPLMMKVENIINSQLLPELGVENVEFQFVVHDPSEERQLAEISEIMARNNFKTLNEIRDDFGLEPLPDGDKTNREFQQEQMEQQAALNPMGDKPASHHKPGEIRESRDATNESSKRERESETNKPGAAVNKDYQQAFQAQIPSNVMTQNMSQPLHFALPKQGHPNTQSPYKELASLCPKCGSEQFVQEPPPVGSLNSEIIMRCGACNATYREEELKEAVKVQEEMHQDPLAPKVVQAQDQLNMRTINTTPNLVATAESQGEAGVPQKQTGASVDTLPMKTDPFKGRKKSAKVK